MKKQIIFNKLFEYGGSNSHLEALIVYFGKENIILMLEEESELSYLANIKGGNELKTIVNSRLHKFAHLIYPSVFSNIKEFVRILGSLLWVGSQAIKHGTNEITLCVVDPEKYLYLLWMPFCRITYIMHSTPPERHTAFTTFTCNSLLGKRKRIVTVSNANREAIIRSWRISETRQKFVSVVYNCVIGNETTEPSAVLRPKGGQYIVTMGHVVAYKNPAFWFEVAKLLTAKYQNVHFVWLGNGPLWDDFKAATKNTERISFKGAVTDPIKYLNEATLYYQPSLSETQGIAVIEAMYNYLPCVVSDVGGLPETVANGYNGIVVNPSILEEHVEALSALIINPELRAEYGLNSHKRASDLFSFGAFKSKMDAVYGN